MNDVFGAILESVSDIDCIAPFGGAGENEERTYRPMSHIIKTMLAGLIDYAGLFPPPAETMECAVGNYAMHLRSEEAFALGKLVVPVKRLGELVKAAAAIEIEQSWDLSVLAGPDLRKDLDTIEAFNDGHAGRFAVSAAEIKPANPGQVEEALELVPSNLTAYYEVPLAAGAYLAVLRGSNGRAKVRTDESSGVEKIASFLKLAAASAIPFKAAEVLHQANGLVRLVLVAALVKEGIDEREARELLSETPPSELRFEEDAVSWRGWRLGSARLAAARKAFLISISSPSFAGPLQDLHESGLL